MWRHVQFTLYIAKGKIPLDFRRDLRRPSPQCTQVLVMVDQQTMPVKDWGNPTRALLFPDNHIAENTLQLPGHQVPLFWREGLTASALAGWTKECIVFCCTAFCILQICDLRHVAPHRLVVIAEAVPVGSLDVLVDSDREFSSFAGSQMKFRRGAVAAVVEKSVSEQQRSDVPPGTWF